MRNIFLISASLVLLAFSVHAWPKLFNLKPAATDQITFDEHNEPSADEAKVSAPAPARLPASASASGAEKWPKIIIHTNEVFFGQATGGFSVAEAHAMNLSPRTIAGIEVLYRLPPKKAIGRIETEIAVEGFSAGVVPRFLSVTGDVGFVSAPAQGIKHILWNIGKDIPRTSVLPKDFNIRVFVRKTPQPRAMVFVPAGVNAGCDPDFGEYSVSVTNLFVDKTEVTFEKWQEVQTWAKRNGYSFECDGAGKGANYPVSSISWYDALKWCNARSEKEGRTPVYVWESDVYKTGNHEPELRANASGYRLPTSGEWEYLARGGLASKRYPWGDEIVPTLANYRPDGVRGPGLAPVGVYPETGLGLLDIAGNLREWTTDESGSRGFSRGGSFATDASELRCGAEGDPNYNYERDIGFRCVAR